MSKNEKFKYKNMQEAENLTIYMQVRRDLREEVSGKHSCASIVYFQQITSVNNEFIKHMMYLHVTWFGILSFHFFTLSFCST